MRYAVIILSLLLSAGTPLQAGPNDPLEIITLQHRMAEDIIPVVRPLLAPDDALSGYNNQLILRTSKQRLNEVHKLLETLDRAPRNLLITVNNTGTSDTRDQSIDSYGRIYRDDRQSNSRSGIDLDIDARDDRYRDTTDGNYRLRALEGQPALLHSGQDVPYEGYQVIEGPYGSRTIKRTTQYRDVRSGFYVVPYLTGNIVTLEIYPQQEQLKRDGSGQIAVQRAETRVSGRLGEWISIGGINTSESRSSSGWLSRGEYRTSNNSNISVKVEVINN